MAKRYKLTIGRDFYVDRNTFRMVEPREYLAMQRLEAALVKEQQAAIHFLVRLVDRHQPGFVHVVNGLSRPKKGDRPAIRALRKAQKTEKQLTNYGMPWTRKGTKHAKSGPWKTRTYGSCRRQPHARAHSTRGRAKTTVRPAFEG